MSYANGEIRGVMLGQTEIVRRIYGAVRDRNWGTVALEIDSETVEDGGDHFSIGFKAHHAQNEIEFHWRGTLRGDAQGTVVFEFDGEAKTSFERNRIGFCVLHPIQECAGAAAKVEKADGALIETHFPREIAPHEPFQGFTALSHKVAPDLWARVSFEGEIFETEDQRNWIDASFKTFGTPLCLPFPVEIEAGTRVWQRVTLELSGPTPSANGEKLDEKVRIEIGARGANQLAPLGLGAAELAPSKAQIAALQTLKPHHLRVELALASEFEARLREVAAQAQILECALEIALFSGETSPTARLQSLAALLDELQTPVHAFLIFADNLRVAPPEFLKKARQILGRFGRIGSGSNANFAEFNRQPMSAELLDLVSFAANPQVHAFDDASVMETPAAISHVIESARALYPGKSVFLSPLSLKPRFNAVAVGPERQLLPGELPPSVDARQKTPFCAAWTLAVFAAFVGCGFGDATGDSLTLFETVGPRGLMNENGAFPVFELLRELAEFRGQEPFLTSSSDARLVAALAFESAVWVANLGAEAVRVEAEGFEAELLGYEVRRLERS